MTIDSVESAGVLFVQVVPLVDEPTSQVGVVAVVLQTMATELLLANAPGLEIEMVNGAVLAVQDAKSVEVASALVVPASNPIIQIDCSGQ